MNPVETKQAIVNSLAAFAATPLAEAATALFDSLGYKSDKRLPLNPNTPDNFLATFAQGRTFNPAQALLADWQSIDLLFQLTDDEVRAAAGDTQQFLFDSKGKYDGKAMESYLFFAVTLKKGSYTRTALSGITRAVNRLFPMPVMLLLRHGDTLTLAVINRRLHKREESKDVLEKVTLIKDIRFACPHRAHVEILFDLSFDALRQAHDFTNFVTLHAAWQKALDSSALNKRFFLEVANWYFWALNHIEFPKDAPKEADGHDHISVIRLITRLIFCWFVKEKGLIPDALFDQRKLAQTLTGFAPEKSSDTDSVFYRAVLQNLFFATLNTEMDKRGWTKEEQNFMAHSLYRFRECFREPGTALDLFKNIPFLNGGLFECLDKDLGEKATPRYLRVDGFSRRPDSQPTVPDFLFFGPEREVDLSADYGDARFKRVTVRGLIHTFDHYKFTITENTPVEEEIALDPELSGKVFENLLAAYNPETGATARKQTGSFFTPREVVNYMVDEALIAYLRTKLEAAHPSAKDVEARLRHLLAYNAEEHQFTPQEVGTLIAAIDELKSLDPAVGSAAFPMGLLHKLVFILGKLDPRNEQWKERQVNRVRGAMAAAEKIEDAAIRERAVRELEQQITGINEAFAHNELDYGRKLYLIENCIYGVDIQPIAVQIAKMRFFISLIVDQKIDDTQPNRGVRPLPNLETKFVAANTLIGVTRPGQQMLRNREVEAKEADLRRVRERHFTSRTPASKAKCREQDARLRTEIAALLQGNRLPDEAQRRFQSLADALTRASDDAVKDLSNPAETARAFATALASATSQLLDIQRSPDVPPLAAARIEDFRLLLSRISSTLKQASPKATGLMVLLNELRGSIRPIFSDLLSGQGLSPETARLLASWDPYDQNTTAPFFDPEWMFGVSDGFDLTIGNPPYVRADEQSEWNQRQRQQILACNQYETLWEKWDLFVPFIERAYKLLRTGGVTTLIVSDAFCHSKYAQKPQNWFLKNSRILRLDFCADLQIFDAAVHNLIYFFQQADGTTSVPERRVHNEEFGNVHVLPSDEQGKLTYRAFFPDGASNQSFACLSVLLNSICYITKGMVVHADEKEARGAFELDDLVADQQDTKHPKRFVEGKHLDRWLPIRQMWLEWGTSRAPSLFSRPTFPQIYTAAEKLISVDMSAGVDKLRVAYDDQQLLHNHSAWSFVPWHMLSGVRNNSLKKAARYRGERPPRPDLPKREELEATSCRFAVKYLLGVMNSSAARDFLRANRRSNIHLYPDDWKKLPVPDIPLAQQRPITAIVDQILAAKRADPNADIRALEAELDVKVNALYGLASSPSPAPPPPYTGPSVASAPGSLVQQLVSLCDGAGKALATVALTVDAAMKAWAAHVAIRKVPDQQEAKVRLAYSEYQEAMCSAVEAYRSLAAGAPNSAWDKAQPTVISASERLLALVALVTAEAGVKVLLRDQILPKLSTQTPYFSIEAVRVELEAARCPLEPATLKRYLHELTEGQFIYDSGRGWYSNLSTPFTLNTQPVTELAALIQKQFHFLKFACWSTDQVKPFMQHLLARNIQFVSAESHTLASAGEFLESNGFTALVNPTKAETRRSTQLKERTVVLRPAHSKEPEAHPFARIEKLLVDLRDEVDCLRLMDVSEFHRLASETVRQGRVQMASLLSYAHAKLFSVEDLFGKEQSTISKYL